MFKKILFSILITGGVMLYAGPDNYYVGIADIKDALYYLIKDYHHLLNNSNGNTSQIIKLRKEINQEFFLLKQEIKKRNIKVDKEIENLMNQVKELNKRALLIRNKEDKYDKYISAYVEKNKSVLEKIDGKK